MAVGTSSDKLSYFNTLVFTIVAGIVSLLILAMLFFPLGKQFIVFIVAVEIGIFAIIAYCIYKIANNETYLRKLRDSKNLVVNFDECGDYYMRRTNSSGVDVCVNNFVITDETNTNYIMKIWSANGSNIPTVNSITDSKINYFGNSNASASDAMNRREVYQLKELATNSNLGTFTDKCRPFFYDVPSFTEYKDIPWTYAKSRCQSFA
jgi:hypothetical protein